jgi:hypothetical protein
MRATTHDMQNMAKMMTFVKIGMMKLKTFKNRNGIFRDLKLNLR